MSAVLLLLAIAAAPVRLDVPLIVREDPYCGPAAVAMLLSFDGHDLPVETIQEQVYTPGLRGTLTVAVTAFLRERGIAHRATRPAAPADIDAALAAGRPIMALLDHGMAILQAPHYVVIVGADETSYFLHSGPDAARQMPRSAFERRWRRAGQWMLVLTPPAEGRVRGWGQRLGAEAGVAGCLAPVPDPRRPR